ncbi:sensor histidine kinase [Rothia nasimurium]|uniref:sensor histidine kinase n=1 Tax=Rothia nasimurium TaxID=85336 RepID=UPI003BA01C5E
MDDLQVELVTVQRRKKLVNGLAVALAQVTSFVWIGAVGTDGAVFWFHVLMWLTSTSSMYWRHRRPKTVTVLALAGLASTIPLDFPAIHVWWVAPVLVYHWARYGQRAVRVATLVSAVVASLVGGYVVSQSMRVYGWSAFELWVAFVVGAFFCLALTVIAWFMGDTRRLRENRHRALIERNRQLEHEREQERQLAALDERARIAREMHDIVAHSLSVIITQADGARYAGLARIQQGQRQGGGQDVPPQAGAAEAGAGTSLPAADQEPVELTALGTISTTARQSLQQMRSLLGVLRTDGGQVFEPLPALHNVPQLVEQMQKLGFTVEYSQVEGIEEKLPQGAELTVYRIVQEALTNIRKHSPATPLVTVTLSAGKKTLDITVTNLPEPTASAPMPGARRGLLGMRERVDMYGGTLHYGRLADGSFRVLAQIPYAP